jgi:hypothetical protein
VTVTFQDGEPVDPKKLQDLQTQIDNISLKANDAYDLSKTTSENVTVLSVMHLKAGVVEFENGLTAGFNNSETIDIGWGADYVASYVTVTPGGNLYKNNIRYSVSGAINAQKLNVWSEKAVSGPVRFHWVSAGKKNLPNP